jgi:hypothetical protein
MRIFAVRTLSAHHGVQLRTASDSNKPELLLLRVKSLINSSFPYKLLAFNYDLLNESVGRRVMRQPADGRETGQSEEARQIQ